MSWNDIKGIIINPLDPPFSNPADEDASYYEWLEEQRALDEEVETPTKKPIYHLLTEVSEGCNPKKLQKICLSLSGFR